MGYQKLDLKELQLTHLFNNKGSQDVVSRIYLQTAYSLTIESQILNCEIKLNHFAA